jgi:hypothetical protein
MDDLNKYKKTPDNRWVSRMRSFGVIFTLLLAVTFAAGFAATQIDLTTQVKGTLAFGNGGTNATSIATGVVRSNGSTLSGAELSGDATTSGSNAVTVVNVNGTSVPTNAAADQVVVTTASATGAWKSVPNCTAGAIQYATATHTFSCGTVLTGSFADDETPTGTINGVNTTFTLAHTPSPAASVQLFKNGQKLEPGGADFSLSTATITTTVAPKTGDVLTASYRF